MGLSIAWVCAPLRDDASLVSIRRVIEQPATGGELCLISDGWAVADFRADVVAADEAASVLSRETSTDVVGLAVHDSDYARVVLYSGGEAIDDVVVSLGVEEEAEPQGLDVSRWAALVAGPATPEDFANIFNSEGVEVAEEYVAGLCRVLGIDFDSALAHHGSATSRSPAVGPANTGQPTIQGLAGASATEVGRRMRMSIWVRDGGAGTAVTLTGQPLDMLQLRSATCGDLDCDVDVTPRSTVITIPNDAPNVSNVIADPGAPAEWQNLRSLELEFEAMAPGTGAMSIRTRGSEMSVAVAVAVEPPRPHPLRGAIVEDRYRPDWNMADNLRNLADGPYLSCRLTFAAPVRDAAAAAARLVERWLDSLPRPDHWRLFLSWEDDDHHISNLKATKRHRSATWKKVGPLVGVNVQGNVLEDPHAFRPAVEPGPGFAWTEHPPFASISDTAVDGGSELVLWAQRPENENEETDLLDALTRQIDGACDMSPLTQAQINFRGATPQAVASLYETVTGVWGTVTVTPSWSARWLREPGRIMWLGPTLQEHVDVARLHAVAGVTYVHNYLRATLRPDHGVAELERACAGALPSHEDWKAAVVQKQLELPDWIEEVRPY